MTLSRILYRTQVPLQKANETRSSKIARNPISTVLSMLIPSKIRPSLFFFLPALLSISSSNAHCKCKLNLLIKWMQSSPRNEGLGRKSGWWFIYCSTRFVCSACMGVTAVPEKRFSRYFLDLGKSLEHHEIPLQR